MKGLLQNKAYINYLLFKIRLKKIHMMIHLNVSNHFFKKC